MSQWTFAAEMPVQGAEVYSGSWAARMTTTAGATPATYAYKTLASTQSDVSYRIRFKIVSRGANGVNLMRFRASGGTSILGLELDSSGRLRMRNDASSLTTNTTTTPAPGAWHELRAHVVVGGAAGSLSEVFLDGVKIAAMTKTDSLGTANVGRVEFGDRTTGRIYDVAFDDVQVTTG
jgi:hypothetical protein